MERASTSENIGGLSIGNIIKHKNLALLFKWLWRFFDEPSKLWCQVIRTKYKYSPTLTISDLKISCSGGPWRLVCASILRNQGAKSIAIKGVKKNDKNGQDSLFWHDVWIGDAALKSIFPGLYAISIFPNGTVASYGFWKGIAWIWSFAWNRVLRPQDLVDKAQMDIMLQQAHVAYESKDNLIWTFNSSGKFSLKSFSLEFDN